MKHAAMIVTNPFVHDSRVLREATTLTERGWRVTVVAAAARGLPHQESDGRLGVVRVPREPAPLAIAKSLLSRRARENGGGKPPAMAFPPADELGRLELGLRRLVDLLGLTRFWRRAAWAVVRVEPDVIIAHVLDALPAGRLAATARRVPLVYDSHELWLEVIPLLPRTAGAHRRWAWAERRLARSSDLVVTVADGIAEELVRRYGIAKPHVLRNVPARRPDAPTPSPGLRERLGVGAQTPVVLYAGGMQPDRGLEKLVAAVGLVPGAVLALLGPGNPAYGESLAAAGAPGTVRPLAPVPPEQVSRLTAEADVGVIPNLNLSLNHYLVLPTKLFEYLLAGVPVVGPDFPELRRVIVGRDVGRTCDTADPAETAMAITDVLTHREALRANARALGSELDWETEARPYAEALERLAAGR